ncbi:hypothetical protein BO94DRAFT_550921 [Aspergillus sclerotioniger CBS 115572]|uniref:Heterokaryon incompatibility domain-containing protein n=1 Tax=Aspergillus sclerotioniger CBS 115572 TaxID=1450535 RepID=A0A317V6S6_9EURO|nr:hypothetical protein BO94DRAFT_550921 [Aspergillus sclerotioniger CBS 115572]PWY68961.1 hypothetical protein BO94DRAFT_550921 [Aspergillus sclerotioniger CBS 115572]
MTFVILSIFLKVVAPYEYEPIDLERPSFRLLHRGERSDKIKCELTQESFDSDNWCPYEALSYECHATELTDHITVNGERLPVNGSVFYALQHLRLSDQERILWGDAVCINQSNMAERKHQVQQMGHIYARAEQVIIWLGGSGYAENVLMDSIKYLERECRRHAYKDWKPTDEHWANIWSSGKEALRYRYPGIKETQESGMRLAVGNSWFKRVWTLQEVANT